LTKENNIVLLLSRFESGCPEYKTSACFVISVEEKQEGKKEKTTNEFRVGQTRILSVRRRNLIEQNY
jgi:hypothetical protein